MVEDVDVMELRNYMSSNVDTGTNSMWNAQWHTFMRSERRHHKGTRKAGSIIGYEARPSFGIDTDGESHNG